jgi:hypothetical protein
VADLTKFFKKKTRTESAYRSVVAHVGNKCEREMVLTGISAH